jgi:hypothetical protein
MIFVITEHNRWENEKWHYAFDPFKQDCGAINLLISFINIANKKFEEVSSEMKGYRCFAASRYSINFYESIEIQEDCVRLVNNKSSLYCRLSGDYTASDWSLNLKLSPRKIKAARDKIRDKGENVLYKSFKECCMNQARNLIIKN